MKVDVFIFFKARQRKGINNSTTGANESSSSSSLKKTGNNSNRHSGTITSSSAAHNGTSSSSGSSQTPLNNNKSSGGKSTKTRFVIMTQWRMIFGSTCLVIASYFGYLGYLETRVNTPFDNQKVNMFQ